MLVSLRRFLRRLLRRPSPAPIYPRVVEGRLKSGRPYRFTINAPLPPSILEDLEVNLDKPAFTAPVTTPDVDPVVETVRPKIIPPIAVSLAAARQHLLELAGLADEDDEDQQRDRRLVWWFRRQRDQID